MTHSNSVLLRIVTCNGFLRPPPVTSPTMALLPRYLTRLNLLPADVSPHENRIFAGTPDPLKDQLQQLTTCMPRAHPSLPTKLRLNFKQHPNATSHQSKANAVSSLTEASSSPMPSSR